MRVNKAIWQVLSGIVLLTLMLHTSVLLAKETEIKRASDAEWLSGGGKIDKSWDDHKYSGTDWSREDFSYKDLSARETNKQSRLSKKSEEFEPDNWQWDEVERPQKQRTDKISTRADWNSPKFSDRARDKEWRREINVRESRFRPSADKYCPTTIRRHYPVHSTVRYVCYYCNCFYPHCHCYSPCWVVYRPYITCWSYYPVYVADYFSVNLSYWDRHGWGFGFHWSGR
ncbi:MAG: hypothetical protein N2246_08775 [Candidatus Sumerlaeia bacterium]|nr:hypothetical protein [Candidatus Sumerlaeia bacterium]